MAIVSHRASGLDALRRRLAALPETARAAAAPALSEIAEGVASEVRAALEREARAGPSAPGAPPADPSGRLAASVAVTADPAAGRSAVAVAAPYAAFLEYGTAHMSARPFLRPVALRAGQNAKTLLAAALRRALTP